MKAIELLRQRVVYSEDSFAELILWQPPRPSPGSIRPFKYRLAFVVHNECVVRYDNETGKGDHRHYRDRESRYAFSTPERLIADFQRDIRRWNDENRHA
jgi:hypothetical protein